MPLTTIISGGQTGVDQAGLRAARRLGLQTGCWATRGWRTQDGPAPWLAEYGLREAAGADYPSRTRSNVREADATVRIAWNFMSAGELCTLRATSTFRKPCFDVPLRRVGTGGNFLGWRSADLEMFQAFLFGCRVRILNVAGNSERTAPGIGATAEEFLVQACTL